MNESTKKEVQKLDRALVRIDRAIVRGIEKLQGLKEYYEHSESEECAQRISREIKAIATDRNRREDISEKLAELNK